jgi:hypothetical protein
MVARVGDDHLSSARDVRRECLRDVLSGCEVFATDDHEGRRADLLQARDGWRVQGALLRRDGWACELARHHLPRALTGLGVDLLRTPALPVGPFLQGELDGASRSPHSHAARSSRSLGGGCSANG